MLENFIGNQPENVKCNQVDDRKGNDDIMTENSETKYMLVQQKENESN